VWDAPMVGPLDGKVVALAESRQLEDLAAMLEKEGASTLRVPMVAILDAPDTAPIVAWTRRLIAGEFAFVVFMTGEGVRRWLAEIDAAGLQDEAVTALRKSKTLIRGPKPAVALKEIGLKADLVAAVPTTDGLIATLSSEALTGRTVGVVLHGAENPRLVSSLERRGALVATVQPYTYAPSANAEKVAGLIQQMAAGTVAALVITSTPQVDRLFEVAEEHGLLSQLADGVTKTRVAAVGPVAAQSLESRGVKVDICPDQGFVMKKLVQLVVREVGR
jgi:uroporphyrinogen-III synthase